MSVVLMLSGIARHECVCVKTNMAEIVIFIFSYIYIYILVIYIYSYIYIFTVPSTFVYKSL